MKPYLVKMPKFVHRLFPKRVWAFPNSKNSVYLTFDDGPIPEVTPWVIEVLKQYKAKATFFCIGDNVNKHTNVFQQIIEEGHSIGNHTYHHLNGWNTKTEDYINNFEKCEDSLNRVQDNKSKIKKQESEVNNLFRPPFGKLTLKQSKNLQKKGFHIIMWDVLSADFDTKISNEKCLENVLKNIQPGSIVVFHDSLKSNEKLRYVLPKVLDYLKINNINCESIKL
jgi:peptidoglycan/xylan/chitin deacetylase (PgdA/CDA1 family)